MIVRVLSLGSRNLLVLSCLAAITTLALDAHERESGAQAYGSNPAAGGYVHTADAKIYYERYGFGGRPVVLLHGGVYGYIDEFANLISRLAPTRTVIAVASRGYGPSELGTQPLSHSLLASDAAAVIRAVVNGGEAVDVVGFSQGATTAYLLASRSPSLIHRMVAIAGALGTYGRPAAVLEQQTPLTPDTIQKQAPDLVARRKRLMSDPDLWEEMIRRTESMYSKAVFVRQDEVRAIQAPTLVMVGDRDRNNPVEHISAIYRLLPGGELAVVPGCGHVVLACKPALTIELIEAFLE